jgi:phosphate transport system protein
MYRRVEQAIKKDPDNLSSYIQLLSASRYLERIADHSTNIAEDVIYLVTGEIIRHGTKTDDTAF